jgi:hypothetical protein
MVCIPRSFQALSPVAFDPCPVKLGGRTALHSHLYGSKQEEALKPLHFEAIIALGGSREGCNVGAQPPVQGCCCE